MMMMMNCVLCRVYVEILRLRTMRNRVVSASLYFVFIVCHSDLNSLIRQPINELGCHINLRKIQL